MNFGPSRFVDCVFSRNYVRDFEAGPFDAPGFEGNSTLLSSPNSPAWLQSCYFVNNTATASNQLLLSGDIYHQGLTSFGALPAEDPPDKSVFLSATDQMILDVAQVPVCPSLTCIVHF